MKEWINGSLWEESIKRRSRTTRSPPIGGAAKKKRQRRWRQSKMDILFSRSRSEFSDFAIRRMQQWNSSLKTVKIFEIGLPDVYREIVTSCLVGHILSWFADLWKQCGHFRSACEDCWDQPRDKCWSCLIDLFLSSGKKWEATFLAA